MLQRKRPPLLLARWLVVALGWLLVGVSACGSPGPAAPASATERLRPLDWKPVEQAMGIPGILQPGGVLRFSFPRTDLQVTVEGVLVKPALALGTHVEFLQTGNKAAMVMGDLVLTADEVNPVLVKLQQGGVEQTALHNHLLGELPRVMYLHIGRQGDPVPLARTIRAALQLTKTPLTAPANPGPPPAFPFDVRQLDQILGCHGKVTAGVYQCSVPRREQITEQGQVLPPAMGVATALNFQPTGASGAAITGDFVLLASEVNPVLRTLSHHQIEITALHSHLLMEAPHLFYLHFWATGAALPLAHSLRAALDQTNSVLPTK